jgi:membrane protease YdiL (CAAX protease family)
MAFQFIRGKAVFWILLLCGLLGALLAFSFIPFSRHLVSWCLEGFQLKARLSHSTFSFFSDFGFVLVAFFLTISLPARSCSVPAPYSPLRLFRLSLLPIIISFGFGFTKGSNLFNLSLVSFPWKETLWAWLLVPIGEELLFRGWITRLLDRLYPESYLTLSPFFPLSLWGSSCAFSLWHLQNMEPGNSLFMVLQLFYALMVGIWLGFIRWQTQKIWPCILAHCLLNFAADWKLWFML